MDRHHEAAENADWLQENREALSAQFEDTDDIPLDVATPLSVTTSFRMSQEEAATIREAARQSGLRQSEWIRTVCLEAARHQPSSTVGINALDARRLQSLLEQAEKIVRAAS